MVPPRGSTVLFPVRSATSTTCLFRTYFQSREMGFKLKAKTNYKKFSPAYFQGGSGKDWLLGGLHTLCVHIHKVSSGPPKTTKGSEKIGFGTPALQYIRRGHRPRRLGG